MKPFKDYDKTQAYTDRPALPTGGYVAKIMAAEEVHYDGGYSKLLVSIDIAEGEYANYYADRYRSESNNPDRRWKGVVRLSVPTDDGTEQDGWTKRSFKTAVEAIEASNSGYHWDWNEAALKGKTVGVLVRQKEWDYDGKHGWAPECFKLIAADLVREGKFKMPEDKPLNGSSAPASGGSADFTPVASNDDDLPF